MEIKGYKINIEGEDLLRKHHINVEAWVRLKAEDLIEHYEAVKAIKEECPCAHIGSYIDGTISFYIGFKDGDEETKIIEVKVDKSL